MEVEDDVDEFGLGGAVGVDDVEATAPPDQERQHCPACDGCFCVLEASGWASHLRNCKPSYRFKWAEGELDVDVLFDRTATQEVSGDAGAGRDAAADGGGPCGPRLVRRFACPWCPPGKRTFALGADLGKHLRKCGASIAARFVLPGSAPSAPSRQSTTAAPAGQQLDRRKRGRGKVGPGIFERGRRLRA